METPATETPSSQPKVEDLVKSINDAAFAIRKAARSVAEARKEAFKQLKLSKQERQIIYMAGFNANRASKSVRFAAKLVQLVSEGKPTNLKPRGVKEEMPEGHVPAELEAAPTEPATPCAETGQGEVKMAA